MEGRIFHEVDQRNRVVRKPNWSSARHSGRLAVLAVYSACAFGFSDKRRQLLSKSTGDSLGDVDGRFALPALQETDVGVMNTGGFGERLLREPLSRTVFSHHPSERRGEPRWTSHRSIYCVTLTSSRHRL